MASEDEDYLATQTSRKGAWEAFAETYYDLDKQLGLEWEKIKDGYKDLQSKKDALKLQNGTEFISDDDILDINAGGDIIRVSRGTMTQIEDTVLEAIFSGRWDKRLQRDGSGRIFLDVNPKCFRCIIDYLNERKIVPPDEPLRPPSMNDEHHKSLGCLCKAFGLTSERRVSDTTILEDSHHVEALYEFLEEDDIRGEMELLYRGSRDGMNTKSFIQKCHGEESTVTVVKTNGGHIFGGYNDQPWNISDDYQPAEKAFLFGLHCEGSTTPQKLPIIDERKQYGIILKNSKGPAFGGGHDLMLFPDASSRLIYSYRLPSGWNEASFTGSTSLVLSEVEVFKINRSSQPAIQSIPTLDRFSAIELPDQVKASVEREKLALSKALLKLTSLNAKFDHEERAMKFFCAGEGKDFVRLNVSGRIMCVTRSTLSAFPQSVFYKQFVDKNWNSADKRKIHPPRDWTPKEVCKWISTLNCSDDVSELFSEVTGAELLSLKKSHLQDLGVSRPGTVALLEEAIQKLRDEDDVNSATFLEHSSYCVGKILDHMRLMAMVELGLPEPHPPKIRDADKERFQRIVDYFFPMPEEASKFLC